MGHSIENTENLTGFNKFLAQAEFNRFAVVCIALLVVGCMGGITVGLGAINSVAALAVVIIPTMTTLSFLLAVAPMRWIMTAGMISLSIDVLLSIFYIIQ